MTTGIFVTLKAGRCEWDGFTVTPLPGKGVMELSQESDGLMHFKWKSRDDDRIGEDLIIVNDAHLSRIPECQDGHCYALSFTSNDSRLVFWIQEPNQTEEDQQVTKFNEIAGGKEDVKDTSLTPQRIDSLVNLLKAASTAANNTKVNNDHSLNKIFNSNLLSAIIEDIDALTELSLYMPHGQTDIDHTRQLLRSPTVLLDAVHALNKALFTTDLNTLLPMLGFTPPPNVLAKHPLYALIEAIELTLRPTKITFEPPQAYNNNPKKNDNENMPE